MRDGAGPRLREFHLLTPSGCGGRVHPTSAPLPGACLYSERMRWYRPATLGELLALKAEHPGAKIVVGNTELGVEMKFKNCHYPVMIQPSRDVAPFTINE